MGVLSLSQTWLGMHHVYCLQHTLYSSLYYFHYDQTGHWLQLRLIETHDTFGHSIIHYQQIVVMLYLPVSSNRIEYFYLYNVKVSRRCFARGVVSQ